MKNPVYLCLAHMGGQEQQYIQRAFETNWVVPLGPNVTEFENLLADYHGGNTGVVALASGTAAIHLALVALGVGKGDEVMVQSFTFCASANPVVYVGATPVFVDSEPHTWNMDPDLLDEAIAERIRITGRVPKAIIPVDLFGQPADYRRILPIAEKYGLKVLEDAAQGFGGSIDGKRACSFGDIGATSFFPAKPLGCYGDGGAIFTDDDAIDQRLRSLRANGRSPEDKYDNREVGFNSRLDTLQAAILLPKFRAFAGHELDDVNRAAAWYTELLGDKVITPYVPEGFVSSWAQYSILLKSPEERAAVQKALKEQDVPSMLYYPRGIHQQGAYRDMGLSDGDYPNTIEATRRVLALPMHPYLTEEDVRFITGIIRRCV